ncbi:hypothetical protein MARINON1_60378 [Marinobacter salarius]|uniref:hypothetical protein n=1 Tax=Marinobacter TaxID=2742 RepID=UPI001256EE97|nr:MULTISPECIES: hypothetical protein [Marinobacter]MDC8457128.1 hypothetical protein [Marinobacter sp. DS40M6]MDP4533291.1 hypothetical protein [Marinobacter salarius]VVS96633.1 hypothetical protein MBHK15_100117 [Marinobacter salarius]VXC49520.1 hypothetical protein MARINON1_60378 [Marinobacter salarius]
MSEVESVTINKLPAGPLFKLVFIITTISLVFLVIASTLASGLAKESGPTGSVFGVAFTGYAEALLHALWGIPLLTLMVSPLIFLMSWLSLKVYCWKRSLGLEVGAENITIRASTRPTAAGRP